MPQNPYPLFLRKQVLAAYANRRHPDSLHYHGNSLRQIAKRFAVSVSWIRKLIQQSQRTESVEPKSPRGGRPPAFDQVAMNRLREAVQQDPLATLKELAGTAGVECSESATYRTLVRLGIKRTVKRGGRPRAPKGSQ